MHLCTAHHEATATPRSPELRLGVVTRGSGDEVQRDEIPSVTPWSSDEVQPQNLADVLENDCLMKVPSPWWGTVPSYPTFFPKGWNKRLCRARRLREDAES